MTRHGYIVICDGNFSSLTHWTEFMRSSICPALLRNDIDMLVTLARNQIDNGSCEGFDQARLNLKIFVFATIFPISPPSTDCKLMLTRFEEVLGWLREREGDEKDVISERTKALLAEAMGVIGEDGYDEFRERRKAVMDAFSRG